MAGVPPAYGTYQSYGFKVEQSMSKITTVLVADDYELIRSALCGLVNNTTGFQVIAACADGAEAVRLARRHKPDILLTDIDMPIMNGLSAASLVLQNLPDTRVLIVSSHADRMYLEAAKRAGARGYLAKRDAAEHIGIALRLIRDGEWFASPSLNYVGFERSAGF